MTAGQQKRSALAGRKHTVNDSIVATQNDILTPEMEAEMEKRGITRFPVYYFQLGKYKYSNLKDAIAQSEREAGTD